MMLFPVKIKQTEKELDPPLRIGNRGEKSNTLKTKLHLLLADEICLDPKTALVYILVITASVLRHKYKMSPSIHFYTDLFIT